MRKCRFTEGQIIKVLKEHAAALSAGELCRKFGISDATFYKWQSRYGGMEISDARRDSASALRDRNYRYRSNGLVWFDVRLTKTAQDFADDVSAENRDKVAGAGAEERPRARRA
jgi:putative transposase